jgi:hypothetical protein
MSTLRSPAVAGVVARLIAAGAREDEAGKARVRAREAELGHMVYGRERAALYGTAPIAVTPEVGGLSMSWPPRPVHGASSSSAPHWVFRRFIWRQPCATLALAER